MIPAAVVDAALWVVLVIVGYVALIGFAPQGQGWAIAVFTALVIASGAWLIAELRKGSK